MIRSSCLRASHLYQIGKPLVAGQARHVKKPLMAKHCALPILEPSEWLEIARDLLYPGFRDIRLSVPLQRLRRKPGQAIHSQHPQREKFLKRTGRQVFRNAKVAALRAQARTKDNSILRTDVTHRQTPDARSEAGGTRINR